MINSKPASVNFPILSVIQNRWSPLAFSDKPVEIEKINSLLEAARWAPSSYNEQPWQYIIGIKGEENHNKISKCLSKGNAWAIHAPLLIISIAKKFFELNNEPNRHYSHDTGMATMSLVLQATEMDLVSHQMGGFDIDKIKKLFDINDKFEPISVIAIGYAGNSDDLEDNLKEREKSPRSRKSFDSLIWK
ncbi:nitroreductase family protein [Candidatus Peregrinibacteria bacterium]|nr:nitroreductase family protein [Candidatus Peregrinibacteria bacterium]